MCVTKIECVTERVLQGERYGERDREGEKERLLPHLVLSLTLPISFSRSLIYTMNVGVHGSER